MLTVFISEFFEKVVERRRLFEDYSVRDRKLILRYHTQAIMGILREWTEEDTQNLDHIVRQVLGLIRGEIRP